MKRQMISAAVEKISDNYVSEAAECALSAKASRRSLRWMTAAASIALVLGLGVFSAWLFTPAEMWTASTNDLKITMVRVDDKMASYRLVDMSPYEQTMIKSWCGELYTTHAGTRFYLIKGQEGLYRLILENDEGLQLVEFDSWVQSMSADRWMTSYWYEQGYITDADIAALDTESEINYGDTLRIIYGVQSAEDIVSVKFEDADIDKTDIGDSIKIKSVILRDGESLERMYGILCGMTERGAWEGWTRIFAENEQYKNGTLPLSEQTERRVTVTLDSGYKLRFDYSPVSSVIKKYGTDVSAVLDEQDNAWLISSAEIDMQYRYYGDAPTYRGEDVTASPVPQP